MSQAARGAHLAAWGVLVVGGVAILVPMAVVVAGVLAVPPPALGWSGPMDLGRVGGTLSLVVAVVVVDVAVLLPVALVVAVRAPRLRTTVSTLTLVPWLAPPIALVVGVAVAPEVVAAWSHAGALGLVPVYALWTVPFAYRVLDAGLRRTDARDRYEAALVAGADTSAALLGIVLPGLRRSLLVAALLTGTAVLAEQAFATLMLRPLLPVLPVALLGGPG